MAKRYSREAKEEVLKKIRGGRRVSEVSKEHGIAEMTVRSWLARDSEGGAAETLEISRLRRENEALYRIVGQLTFESERQKKNQRRERC
jgi:transposase-like protein